MLWTVSEVPSVFCVTQNVTNIHCSCLHLDKRSGLVFPGDISHVRFREIMQHCLQCWHEAQRQVVDACVALLNLAVSEQITERFQIIVRPVPALVIRHAVLSERKGSWWGKVTATWDSVVRSLRSDCFSQDTFWLAMALFLPGWYTVLAVFLSRYRLLLVLWMSNVQV